MMKLQMEKPQKVVDKCGNPSAPKQGNHEKVGEPLRGGAGRSQVPRGRVPNVAPMVSTGARVLETIYFIENGLQ